MANRIVLNNVSYHGAGAVAEIGNELAARGCKKVFIASGAMWSSPARSTAS